MLGHEQVLHAQIHRAGTVMDMLLSQCSEFICKLTLIPLGQRQHGTSEPAVCFRLFMLAVRF